MAQTSDFTDQNSNNKMPGKQTKQINTGVARIATKKLPTPSPSSYTFAPRWMAKASHEPTSPTSSVHDENFPSLSMSGDDGKKKRSVWNDPTTVKKKVISPTKEDDPFAGMNTLVDYQQEIERLKALVPKVEKKRSSIRKSNGGLWNDLRSGQKSRVVSPTTSQPMLSGSSVSSSNTSSVASDDDTKSDPSSRSVTDESQPSEEKEQVITEEEKARFLEFMRSWTGGWQGWGRNDGNEGVRKDGSLWAGRSPWESSRRRSWHEPRPDPLNIPIPQRYPHETLIQSEPSTPLYESHWSEHTFNKREDLYQQQRYGQQPQVHYNQIGAIGDRHGVRVPRMGSGGAPFGVFVM
ncbi:hypothetical protein BJV82DRAFT_589818 [Fennellomyces sp. T-0311]|nr:hypothetical protein BJV82DRAFT_589818 [Fennellomyces sp. T-0311]